MSGVGRPVSRTGAVRTVVLRGVSVVVAEPVAQRGPLADLQGAGAAGGVIKPVGKAAAGAQRLGVEAASARDGAAKGVGLAGINEGPLANP